MLIIAEIGSIKLALKDIEQAQILANIIGQATHVREDYKNNCYRKESGGDFLTGDCVTIKFSNKEIVQDYGFVEGLETKVIYQPLDGEVF